jgi:hypothetical protein
MSASALKTLSNSRVEIRPGVCFSNGVSGGFHLVGLRGRPVVGEGDGECVESGLPSHRPSGAATSGGVEATSDKISPAGSLQREVPPGTSAPPARWGNALGLGPRAGIGR